MNIRIGLNTDDLNELQRTLNRYRSELELKLPEMCKQLAEVGIPIVTVRYAAGASEHNGNYSVSVEPTEKGCKLVAQGTDVCFLEFGAGVSTKKWEGEGQEGLPPIYPGSWSETEGTKQFAKFGYWYYGGKRYEGLEPKMGMYYASKEMQGKAIEVLRRFFK